MPNEFFQKKLSEYEINKIRGEPQKYLWDALDRYFDVLNMKTAVTQYSFNDLLSMRILAADDVEMTALACQLIRKREEGETTEKTDYEIKVDKIVDPKTLEEKNKLARLKVGLVLEAMKKSAMGKLNLTTKEKKGMLPQVPESPGFDDDEEA